MKLCIVLYYDLKNMKWKGCPKFDQGKVAILDFKMADDEFSLFAHISVEMAIGMFIRPPKNVGIYCRRPRIH